MSKHEFDYDVETEWGELSLTVEFTYTPGYEGSRDEPAEDAEVEITEVSYLTNPDRLDGQPAVYEPLQLISSQMNEWLEKRCWESLENAL